MASIPRTYFSFFFCLLAQHIAGNIQKKKIKKVLPRLFFHFVFFCGPVAVGLIPVFQGGR